MCEPNRALAWLQVLWDDSVDADPSLLSGGNGTDVAKLPLNGTAGCKPVYPNQWARVNNIFQVRSIFHLAVTG